MSDLSHALQNLSFEQAFSELEEIVRLLEDGKSPLEDAIKAYERGVLLKQHCEEKLREATLKIEKILMQPNGDIALVPDNTLSQA